jgi:DNA-binding CsgD family transcriptional regulator
MDKRNSARNPWAVVLLILVLSCAIAYGIAALGTKMFTPDSFGHTKTLEIANLQDLQTTADGFVYYDGSTVSSINSEGDVRWSYLVGGDAGFSATDYGVATWVGKTITLIDGKSGSTTFNGNMEENVLSAHIGNQYTAILIGSETDSTIVLMESGGKQVSQIAKELSISVSTVSTYRARILEKMHMKNSAELTHYALQKGLVDAW